MRLPTWEEIEKAPDYEALSLLFWQPVPAFDSDARARVRRMAERMAAMQPSIIPPYLPLPADHQPAPDPQEAPEKAAPPPPPPKPKAKPKPSPEPAADISYFKSLFAKP